MRYQPVRYERERSYPMPVAEAWRLLAATDHLNRAIGLPSVQFSTLPDPLVRRAQARAFGVIPVRWHELPFDWIRERRYAARREFVGGPVAVIVAGIELRPAEQGVTVRSYAECTSCGAAEWLAIPRPPTRPGGSSASASSPIPRRRPSARSCRWPSWCVSGASARRSGALVLGDPVAATATYPCWRPVVRRARQPLVT